MTDVCHCGIDSASLCEMIMLQALRPYQGILVLSPTKKASIKLREQFAEVYKKSILVGKQTSACCVKFNNETYVWFYVASECVGRGLSLSMAVIDDSKAIKPKKLNDLLLAVTPALYGKESMLVINTPEWG